MKAVEFYIERDLIPGDNSISLTQAYQEGRMDLKRNDGLLANGEKISLNGGEYIILQGGSFTVDWLGSSSLTGKVLINGVDISQESNAANNTLTIPLNATFDLEISAITIMDANGVELEPTDLPFGETIYIYHTYRNNSYAPIRANGYYL